MNRLSHRPTLLSTVIALIIGLVGLCGHAFSEDYFDSSRFTVQPGVPPIRTDLPQEANRPAANSVDRWISDSESNSPEAIADVVSEMLGFEDYPHRTEETPEKRPLAQVQAIESAATGPASTSPDLRLLPQGIRSDNRADATNSERFEFRRDPWPNNGGTHEAARPQSQQTTLASNSTLSGDQVERLPAVEYDQNSNAELEIVPTPEANQDIDPWPIPSGDAPSPVAGDFPRLPPPPHSVTEDALPPLADELYYHGGSYLYQPEGDRLNWPAENGDSHFDLLRLPEDYEKPRPVEGFAEFLGVGAPQFHPDWYWEGPFGYVWEPRFVGYGNYRLFGLGYNENGREQYGIGHQLELELDLRLTGTERFHVQFKPIGYENRGGSFYQFNRPSGYVDNSRATPDRYWFEGELHSMLGGTNNPFVPMDYHFVIGRFPMTLHNNLLLNSDLMGIAVNKNTIYAGNLSNLNVQGFVAREDVSAFNDGNAYLAGCNAFADWRHLFVEASYVYVVHESDDDRNAHYVGLSGTQMFGPWVLAGRAFGKFGDKGGRGDGHLFVIESNRTRYFDHKPLGVEQGVFYFNGFYASEGWNPIAGGNFDRLRSSFEVNPLVSISAGNPISDNVGAAFGVQLFRHHKDESIIPEVAIQSPMGTAVFGTGIRYQRKTGPRTFFEVLGNATFSDDPTLERRGILVTQYLFF